jgi:hypothetical protein
MPAHPEAKDLKRSLPASGGYFDAHTHWPNGILPSTRPPSPAPPGTASGSGRPCSGSTSTSGV